MTFQLPPSVRTYLDHFQTFQAQYEDLSDQEIAEYKTVLGSMLEQIGNENLEQQEELQEEFDVWFGELLPEDQGLF